MIKQRKRVSTRAILEAANWVRENIHILADQQWSKTQWCELLSEGVGEQFTISTALEILTSNGINVTPAKPADPIETRVSNLEQQVVGLLQSIQSIQAEDAESVFKDGRLFPRVFDNESEVENELSRS